MATITIKVMTHDRSRCAEVTLQDSLTVASLVFQCQKRWQLDHNEIFAVRDLSRNNRLEETDSLSTAGVRSGTELQIFPLVEGGAPMTSVRQRRLQSDYERLNALVAAQSMLSIESARGNPPETYVIVFRRRSIAELRGNVPVFCGRQRMKIEMPTDYPAVPPLVTVLAPMFHPHVWPR